MLRVAGPHGDLLGRSEAPIRPACVAQGDGEDDLGAIGELAARLDDADGRDREWAPTLLRTIAHRPARSEAGGVHRLRKRITFGMAAMLTMTASPWLRANRP